MYIHTLVSMTILTAMEHATLKALAEACNYSLSAHVPREAVTSKFPKHLRGDVKKCLKKLKSKGFCSAHPTGRNTTYELTINGLNAAQTF